MKKQIGKRALSLLLTLMMLLTLLPVGAFAATPSYDGMSIVKDKGGAVVTCEQSAPPDDDEGEEYYYWQSKTSSSCPTRDYMLSGFDNTRMDITFDDAEKGTVYNSVLKYSIRTNSEATLSFDICMNNYTTYTTNDEMLVFVNGNEYDYGGQDAFTHSSSNKIAEIFSKNKTYTVNLQNGDNTVEFCYRVTTPRSSNQKACAYLSNIIIKAKQGDTINTFFSLEKDISAQYKIGNGELTDLNSVITAAPGSTVTVYASYADTTYQEFGGFWLGDEKVEDGKTFTFTADAEKTYNLKTKSTELDNFPGVNEVTTAFAPGGAWSYDPVAKTFSANESGKLILRGTHAGLLHLVYTGTLSKIIDYYGNDVTNTATTRTLSDGKTLLTIPVLGSSSGDTAFEFSGASTITEFSNFGVGSNGSLTTSVKCDYSNRGTAYAVGALRKDGTDTYTSNPDDTIVLIAEPKADSGYRFVGWYRYNDLVSESPVCEIKAEGSYPSYEARFADKQILTVNYVSRYGTVEEYAYSYPYGDTVTLTAVPKKIDSDDDNSLCRFLGWFDADGNKVCDAAEYSFVIKSKTSLEARFAKPASYVTLTYQYDISKGKIQSGILHWNEDNGDQVDIAANTGYIYLTAVPNEGYMFEGWYVNGTKVSDTANDYRLTGLTDDATVEARFIEQYDLTFKFDPSWFSTTGAGTNPTPRVHVNIFNANGENITATIAGNQNTFPDDVRSIPEGCYIEITFDPNIYKLLDLYPLESWDYNGVAYKPVNGKTTINPKVSGTVELKLIEFKPVSGYTPDASVTSVETKANFPWEYTGGVLKSQFAQATSGYNFKFSPLKVTVAQFDSTYGILYFDYMTYGTGNKLYYNTGKEISGRGDAGNVLLESSDWETCAIQVRPGDIVYLGYYNDGYTSQYAQIRNLRVVTGTATVTAASSNANYGTVSGSTGLKAIGDTVTLTANPLSGYKFYGWQVNGKTVSTANPYSFSVNADTSVTALFNTPDAYAARIGMEYYATVEAALAAAQSGDTVFVLKNATLSSNATVPAGVTLVVPYSNTQRDSYSKPAEGTGTSLNPSLFRTLTIASGKTLTVNGTLVVDAVVGLKQTSGYRQDISGAYAKITNNGAITIANGGAVDCFGKIDGSGSINVNGTLTDLYVVEHWRGGTQASNMNNNAVYPMNEYSQTNVTNTVNVYSGGVYSGYVRMYTSGGDYGALLAGYHDTRFPQISNANGLVRLGSGAVATKTLSGGREVYTISGDVEFNSSTLKIVDMNLSTGGFIYPWDGDMTFNVTGNVTFNQSFKFMPGAVLNVYNGNVTVSEGKTVVFYDKFNDTYTGANQYPTNRTAAYLDLGNDSTMTVNGTFAGIVKCGKTSGQVTKGANAAFTASPKEASGTGGGAAAISFSFLPQYKTGYGYEWNGNALKFVGNAVTVTFDVNGGDAMDDYVGHYDDEYTPAPASRTGYVFAGWYLADGSKWVDGTKLTGDITLKAEWTADTVNYTVKHHFEKLEVGYHDIETETLQGTSDTNTAAAAKDKPGFTAKAFEQANIAPDGSTVIDIYYTRNSYALTWELGGGELSSSGHDTGDVKFGKTIVKPSNDPTKTGYSFAGWDGYNDGMTMPANAVTMTAKWTADKYTVTFKANDGVTDDTTKEVTYDSTYGDLPELTRTGYTFDGWFTAQNGGTEVKATDTVTYAHAHTLYAHWTAKTFTVTLDPNGGTLPEGASATMTVTYGQQYGTLPTPTKEGYGFLGWYNGQTKIENSTTVALTEDVTLTAQWGVMAYSIEYYIDDILDPVATQNYNYGQTIVPYTYVKEGYDVSDWVVFPRGSLPETMPARSLAVSATTTPHTYTITYKLDGGTVETANPTTYTIESDTFTLNNPTKTGYTFAGWTLAGEYTKVMNVTVAKGSTGDLEYTANWTVNKYKLTYTVDGNEKSTQEVNYNAEVTVSANETKTGYTFSGWSSENVTIANGKFTMPDNDVTISGSFTANTYTVKFDPNGGSGTMEDMSFKYDEAQNLTANSFTNEGYNFTGWKIAGTETTLGDEQNVNNLTTEANGVITLVAQWGVNQYTITFDTKGGSTVSAITANYGDDVTAPADPTREGYLFGGWDQDIPATMPAKSFTINAKWISYLDMIEAMNNFEGSNLGTARGYYALLNDQQKQSGNAKLADLVEAIKAADAAALKAKVEEKVVSTNDKLIVDGVKVAELTLNGASVDVRLVEEDYLAFKMRSVPFLTELFTFEEITSIQVGGQAAIETITQDALMLAVAAEAGVDLSQALEVTVSVLDGKTMNVVLNAKTPEGIAYSVTYTLGFFNDHHNVSWDADGGTLSGEYTNGSTAYGTAITAPAAAKTGYTFAGWDNDVHATMGKTDLSFKALWTANEYTVSFDPDGGSVCSDQKATFNEKYGTLPTPTRTGYTFDGWFDGENKVDADTVFATADDVELKAHWTINSYNVIYKVDNETVKTESVEYNATIPAYTYTKTGYTVSAWTGLPGVMPANDVTVTATTTINTYTVTYKVNDEVVQTESVEYNATIPAYTYTKTGYTVSAWSGLPETMPANDVTVTATATAHVHNVVYKVDNEQTSSAQTAYDTVVTLLDAPPKTGYTFSGWSSEDVTIANGKFTMPDNDVTVSGTFTANTYTVKFSANGGTGTMDAQSFTYDKAQNLTANVFTKTGYTFAGWKLGDKTYADKESVSNLTADANGEVTLVAQWTVNRYTITFDTKGGSAIAPITADYGTTITAPAAPTKAGYKFNGWDKDIPETMPAENMTVTAKDWTSYVDIIAAMENFEGENLTTARGYYAFLTDAQKSDEKLAAFKEAVAAAGVAKLENAVKEAVAPTNEKLVVDGVKLAELRLNEKNVDVVLIYEEYPAINMASVPFLTELFKFGEITSIEVGDRVVDSITQNALMFAVAEAAGVGIDISATISVLDGKTIPVVLNAKTSDGIPYSSAYVFSFFNEKHNVTWDADGGELSGEYTNGSTAYGTAIVKPADPTKPGYAFTNWDKPVPETMGKEDLSFKALWTANTYTVKFDANGGTGTMASQRFTYDAAQALTENAFTKTGCHFAGWKLDDTTYEDGQSVSNLTADANGEVTLVAQWELHSFGAWTANGEDSECRKCTGCDETETRSKDVDVIISYDKEIFGGKEAKIVADQLDESAVVVTNINKYISGQKNKEATVFDITTLVDDVITPPAEGSSIIVKIKIPASYKANTVQMYYVPEDGDPQEIDCEVVNGYVVFAVQHFSAYAIVGETEDSYTVIFDANGGSGTMEGQKFYFNQEQALTANSYTKTGYHFAGWKLDDTTYADGQSVSNLTSVANAEVTLVAQWAANTYKVSFNANGGSACSNITVTYDGTYGELPTPTREGYTFKGWYVGGTQIKAEDTVRITEDTELTAQWEANADDGDDSGIFNGLLNILRNIFKSIRDFFSKLFGFFC